MIERIVNLVNMRRKMEEDKRVFNDTNLDGPDFVPPAQKHASSKRLIKVLFIAFVGISIYLFLGYLLSMLNNTFVYEESGQAVFSIKYSDLYEAHFEKDKAYDDQKIDYVGLRRKCSISEVVSLYFDCGFDDWPLIFRIYSKDDPYFANDLEEYLEKKPNYDGTISTCKNERVGNTEVCYFNESTNSSEGLIFRKDYMIYLSATLYSKGKTKEVNKMLSSFMLTAN